MCLIPSLLIPLLTLSCSPVCLVVVLIGASVFHIRRKQKEKRPQTEQRAFDVERGQRRNQCKNRIQRPTLTYSRDSENPGKLYTSLSGGTAIEELRSDAGVAAPVERRPELAKVHQPFFEVIYPYFSISLTFVSLDSLSFSFLTTNPSCH